MLLAADANAASAGEKRQSMLLCKVGSLVCGLPLGHVSETMRPLPLEPLANTVAFVDGMSIIRGMPVPVVDLARLLGKVDDEARTRLVLVKVALRYVALSVRAVLGVRSIDAVSASGLPPLLGGASTEFVTAVGALDAQLFLVLETSRILPASLWASLESAGGKA